MDSQGAGRAAAARAWEVVEREPVADCQVFHVERLVVGSPRDGRSYVRHVLEVPDWVNVVAFTDDGHIILVEQYRFGAGILSLEFPAGILEPGENPAEGGVRELREETGYDSADAQTVGFVYANPALQDNRQHAVLARGCRRVAAPHQDEGEDVHLRLVTPDELRALIRDGTIRHALALATWFLVQEHLADGGVR